MVLMTGLDSIIESLYLNESLTTSSKNGNILVNPISSYIVGKTVIINLKRYPLNYIDELIENKNTIISRFELDDKRVIFDPYELRINERIIPLGKKVNVVNEDILDKVDHIYDHENGCLYYPKPLKCIDFHKDKQLTVLGYLAYQLGYQMNDIVDTEFKYLDIIKLKNGLII